MSTEHKKRPQTKHGSLLAEESDKLTLAFFRGHTHEGVVVTGDQLSKLSKLYEINLDKDENVLMKAGAVRNTFRRATADGLRIMAFLAKYDFLVEGEDPVTSMAMAMNPEYWRSTPDCLQEEYKVVEYSGEE